MKLGILIITALALLGGSQSWAEAPASATPKSETPKAEKKSSRKKKLQMCAECGKPEPECECPHTKTSKKDDNKVPSESASPKN